MHEIKVTLIIYGTHSSVKIKHGKYPFYIEISSAINYLPY